MSPTTPFIIARQTFTRYRGMGRTQEELKEIAASAEQASAIIDESPEGYVAAPGLRNAVNVALALDLPLLVTGEPGTGKTRLAESIAHELDMQGPLVFHTKTTSAARDVLYEYDALRHFRASAVSGNSASRRGTSRHRSSAEAFLTFHALGKAILGVRDPNRSDTAPTGFAEALPEGKRSLVLIDEIDKAPRDFANDLLNEVDRMEFSIAETGKTYCALKTRRPFLLLTSNSEKNLPGPFLRRCAFYHIPAPDDVQLQRIVRQRLPALTVDVSDEDLKKAIALFNAVRELDLLNRPSTDEFQRWFQLICRLALFPIEETWNNNPATKDALLLTYSTLIKIEGDYQRLCSALGVAPKSTPEVSFGAGADDAARRADSAAAV